MLNRRRREHRHRAYERGQASVELVAIVPFALLAGLIVFQLALAGHAAWMSANAARVAARAETVGKNGEQAARSALPAYLERGLQVERAEGSRVTVRVRVPYVVPIRAASPVAVSATAALGQAP